MSSNILKMDYNEDMAEWRPSGGVLAQARSLVRQHPSATIRRRLVILDALAAAPGAPVREIARAAATRTRVVRNLLRRWRDEGPSALTHFGRPDDLDAAGRWELQRAIRSVPLRSLTEAGQWLMQKRNLWFSQPTVRRYCRELGFDLPARYKAPKSVKPKRPLRQWTPAQVADLNRFKPALPRRITAILRLGSAGRGSISRVAREGGVPASTVRLDLKHFERGGAKAVVNHLRRENRLRRAGVWDSFTAWCRQQHEMSGICPPARLARKYLRKIHSINMPVRTVYTHLSQWRREAGIPLRRWSVRDRFTPSQGLTVRSIHV